MIGVARALPRYATISAAASKRQTQWRFNGGLMFVAGATTATTAMGIYNANANPPSFSSANSAEEMKSSMCSRDHKSSSSSNNSYHRLMSSSLFLGSKFFSRNTACEAAIQEFGQHHHEITMLEDEEEEKFLDTLALYRRWLLELKKQWEISSPASIKWPNNIPDQLEISALEMDLQMYHKGHQEDTRKCEDLEFRIASYYLFREESVEQQKKGFNMVKKLSVDGHPDGLCLYAMVWNHGGVAGMEAQPHLAVKYWRQAADAGHLASMYELGVALYIGDGTVEDPIQAVQYFKKAADLGHSGAAYLMADCYLDGVGVQRDRSKAFEWLMTAAEMGHRQAQRRGEALLTGGVVSNASGGQQQQNQQTDAPPMASMSSTATTSSAGVSSTSTTTTTKLEEEESIRWEQGAKPSDWYRKVSLERRFTIGGGSRNPRILFRRKTNVAESRRSEG